MAGRKRRWYPRGTKPDGRGRSSAPSSFEPGNTLQLRHGAWSEALINPLAQRIAADLAAQAAEPGSRVAYLAEPSYRASLNALSRTEARVALVASWLEEHGGDIDQDGEIRAAAHLLTQLENLASKERSKLGLDPLSRARLGKDIAGMGLDLARVWAAESAQEARSGSSSDEEQEWP